MDGPWDEYAAPPQKKQESATQAPWDEYAGPTRTLDTAPAPAPDTGDGDGDFMRGFKRTLPELKQLAGGTLAAVGDVTGLDKVRDYGLDVYRAQERKLEPLQRPTDSFTEAYKRVKEGDLGAGVDFLQNAAGYTSGQALESLASVAAGAAVGGALTAPLGGEGAVPGAIGGLVAKQGVKRLVKREAEKIIEEQIAKGATKQAAKQAGAEYVAANAAKDVVAKQVAEKYTKAQLAKLGGRTLGGVAGAQALNTTFELGSVYPEAYQGAQDEGRDLTGGEKAKAVGASLAAAGLESVADLFNLSILFRGVKGASAKVAKDGVAKAVKAYAGRAAVASTEGALREAGTEGAQTFLERVGASQSLDDADAWRDYIDSAAVGAVGGVLFGAGAALHPAEGGDARHPDVRDKKNVPFGQDPADTLRANVTAAMAEQEQAKTPAEQAAAQQAFEVAHGALVDYLADNGRMLTQEPTIVGPDGTATTPAQGQPAGTVAPLSRPGIGLTPDVQAAQRQHPGFTLPDPDNGPLSRVVNAAAHTGALGREAERQGVLALDAQAAEQDKAGKGKSQDMPPPPANMDPTTGELIPWAPEQVLAYLTEQAGRSHLPKPSEIARAFDIKPRLAAELRRQAIINQNNAATESANDAPTGRAGPEQTRDRGPVGDRGRGGHAEPVQDAAGGQVGSVGVAPAAAAQEPGTAPAAGEGASAESAQAGSVAPRYDTSTELQPTDITPPSGGPFTIEDAARREAARTEGGRVFPVDGGFVVRTALPAESSVSQGDQQAPAPSASNLAPASAEVTPPSHQPQAASTAAGQGDGAAGGKTARQAPGSTSQAGAADSTQSPSATPSTHQAAPASIEGAAVDQGASPSQQTTPAPEDVQAAAAQAATSPTNALPEPSEAQKEAGNFKVGRMKIAGLDVSIEHPAGVKRKAEHTQALTRAYGYIRGSVGKDKEHVDVFLGDRAADESLPVFVVDQRNKDGSFDEHKVILGEADEAAARKAYLSNYPKGWTGLGDITQMSQDEFKRWVTDPSRTKRPAEPLATNAHSAASKQQPATAAATDDGPQAEWAAVVDDLDASHVTAVAKKMGITSKDVAEQRRQLAAIDEAKVFPVYEQMADNGELPVLDTADTTTEEDWDYEVANFPAPERVVDANKEAGGFITPEAAAAKLQEWKAEAKRIGKEEDHSNDVIISLFDATGEISKPWRDAGYDVLQYDIKLGDDLLEFFPSADLLEIKERGKRVVGVIAQPPCTCFSSSGARWWSQRHDKHDRTMVEKMFGPAASRYFSKPKEYTRALVSLVDLIIGETSPAFTMVENPVGRIATEMGLPAPTLKFDPNVYGNPYTKRTQLWGKFNPDLPTANVEPTQGSLMHKLWSTAEKQGGTRSITPEGFAYAFFMANRNAASEKTQASAATAEQAPPPSTKRTPEKPKRGKQRLAGKDEARTLQADLFREIAADGNLVGKSVAEIEAAVREKADGRLTPAKVGQLARALHKDIKRRAVELEKQKHRDPAVYKGAVDDALADAYPDGNVAADEQSAFQAGFAHAIKGKTKSTLTGQFLADSLKGYKAARAWMKTEQGSAYYEGRAAKKLQNTGVDLRRWYEQRREELKSKESDGKKLWAHLKKLTTRADLFPITPAEGATPGVTRFLEYAREQTVTFADYLANWVNSDQARFVSAEQYSPHLDTRRSKWQGPVDQRFARFLDSVIGEGRKYSLWEERDAPESQWVPDTGSLDKTRKRPPTREISADEAREKIEQVARDYISAVEALHGALSTAKTGLQAVEAAERFRGENPDAYDRLLRSKIGDKSRRRDPLENEPYTRVASILRSDEAPLPDKGANRRKPLTPPRLDGVKRADLPDHRNGKDVTPQQFKDTFGFADVGFGKWVGAKQDQDHLNYAFDAFSDLAQHFGIPPKLVGFNGKMHFTIGALGHGKFAAHFSPNQPSPMGPVPVINVTNTRGDGTVYHEWGHAFDLTGATGDWPKVRAKILRVLRYRAVTPESVEKRAADFLTGGSKWVRAGRLTKVEAALLALSDAQFRRYTRTTDYYRAASALDGKNTKNPYWSNDKELFARAVEAWAGDTLAGTNTYLVNPAWSGEGMATKENGYRGTPYPLAEERKLFNQALTALTKAVSVKDGVLTVSEAEFDKHFPDPDVAGEARRKSLLDKAAMTSFYNQLLNEQRDAAEEKARAKQAETDRLAAEAQAQLDAELGEPPSAEDAMGPLDESDLEALFDEASAELRESQQEEPKAPTPGAAVADLAENAKADRTSKGSGALPAGWTEASPGGLATSKDPERGGIVDRELASGKWFAIPEKDGLGPLEGFATRAAAFKALEDATAPADVPLSDQQAKTAAALAKEAAKLGVKGVDEAMQGLVALFGGGKGRLNSFPSGFDQDAYAAAKPHFERALTAFQAAGKSLKDLFKFLIQHFGDGIKMYAVQFAKEKGLTTQLGSQPSASMRVADWVAGELDAGRAMDWRALFNHADEAFGGTQAEGKYTPKDAYDALEAGVNRFIAAHPAQFTPQVGAQDAIATIAALDKLTALLPTQSKRTAEMDQFQQFSTVPPFAYAANWVANISPDDVMLEPSAGIGGLAVFARAGGAKLVLNELSSRRAAVLQDVFPAARVFHENAEQLDNILPADVVPSVVVMNPPFSASAGRVSANKTTIGAQHIEQALDRLAPGGRLVAIVGDGMRLDAAKFRGWWAGIQKAHAVRAVVPVSGKGYAKYGTTFDNVLLVIDKVAPKDQAAPITTPVQAYNELPGLLSEIRNDRPTAQVVTDPDQGTQRDTAESSRSEPDEASEGEPGAGAGTGVAADVGAGNAAAQPAVGAKGGRRGGARGAGRRGSNLREPGNAGDRARDNAGGRRDGAAAESGGPDTGVAITSADSAAGELTDSIFEGYQPQRLQVEGAKPHPGPLVQSAAMASVLPPAPTYTPNLPKATIEKGMLSLPQIEAVVYAGQAHSQLMPDGTRRGFFIGDGTGVGKGREISGIILDNLRQGRKKAVWITEKQGLLTDAKRDFKGVGGDASLLFNQGKTKATDAIAADDGILFTTYSTLRSGSQKQKKGDEDKAAGQSRLDQLVTWLGKDFDGVLVFDEAHNAGNAVPIKGKRGVNKPSAQALAVVDLQQALPKARVVYVSATGATQVSNLSYATRLGLWGEGTAFAGVQPFIAEMTAGGLSTMELVARDMKQMGAYIARSLSYEGVTYSRIEHELSDLQTDIYNRMADAWQVVLQNFNEALEAIGAVDKDGKTKNSRAVAAAKSAFWGGQQRFFNQVITSMQMPSVIAQMERDIANGDALVLQLVNTNEAQQERALAKRKEADEQDLEELDLTPRDQLLQMVEHSFPVVQMEDYEDEEGRIRSRAVVDSTGKPVENKKAAALRDQLLKDLQDIRVPDGPLEMVLNHFGPDVVAEVTGRTQRVVRTPDDTGNAAARIEKRGPAAARGDAEAFMADRKQVLVFSDAGGTGFSFHADLTKKNQRPRKHYLIQPGWRADKAVQGFGRTHRTNQASAPHYYLAATNIPAHKRFLSSIARKLDQLGALTSGQRDTANQGMFSEKDNLESPYATQAVRQLFEDLQRGTVADLEFMPFLRQMGLENILDPETGQIGENSMPPVSQFLNRMLSLTLDMQERVFDAFMQRMEEKVETAIARGEFDAGIQTIKALNVKVEQEETIHTDPRTGAETKFMQLELTLPNTFHDFPTPPRYSESEWVVNDTSGRVWLKIKSGTMTLPDGQVVDKYRLQGTGGTQTKKHSDLYSRTGHLAGFKTVSQDEARALWQKENAERPTTVKRTTYLITGAVLPVWDRLTSNHKVEVVRTQTQDGRRLLGRQVLPGDVKEVRKRFDISSTAAKATPEDVMRAVLAGQVGELANGRTLERAKVSDSMRVELKTRHVSQTEMAQLIRMGLIHERINWQERLFVPVGKDGIAVLKRLLESQPLIDLSEPSGTEPKFSRPDRSLTGPVEGLKAGRANQAAPAARVQQIAASILAGWSNAPKLRVLDAAPTGENADVEGWYDDATGTIVLVAPNLRGGFDRALGRQVSTTDRIRMVTIHEAVGHAGIEAITGPALWAQIAKTIDKMRASGKHADLFADIDRRYRGANRDIATREAVAVMIEKGMRNSVVDRVIAAIRQFLRKVLGLNMAFSEAELRQHAIAAARYLRGDARPRAAPALRQAALQSRTPGAFYSALAEAVAAGKGAPRKADAAAWRGWLDGAQRRGEFKKSERDWMGLDAWLDGQGAVSRDEVADFIRANQVQVQDVMLGAAEARTAVLPEGWTVRNDRNADEPGQAWVVLNSEGQEMGFGPTRTEAIRDSEEYDPTAAGTTKFASYTLPGGQNYRELLLTLPVKGEVWSRAEASRLEYLEFQYGTDLQALGDDLRAEVEGLRARKAAAPRPPFSSSHFDQANILAHVRFNERTDADGKRVLFLEEVQSDWHQQGRKQGYGPQARWMVTGPDHTTFHASEAEARAELERRETAGAPRGKYRVEPDDPVPGTPDAPLKNTDEWAMLAFKRMVRYAADHGFDSIAWTTGEQQAARYDLSKQVESIIVDMPRENVRRVRITAKGGTTTVFDVDTAGVVGNTSNHNANLSGKALDEVVGKDMADKIMQADSRTTFEGEGLAVGGEGMRAFYDKILPAAVNKWGKKFGGKVGTTSLTTDEFTVNGDDITPDTFTAHSLDITPQMRETARAGLPLFSRRAAEDPDGVVADIEAAMNAGNDKTLVERARAALAALVPGKLKDQLRPSWLALLTTDHLTELLGDYTHNAGLYSDLLKEMGAQRNELQQDGEHLTEAVRQWATKHPEEARRLFKLMHDATIDGSDPSTEYQPLQFRYSGKLHDVTKQNVKDAIKAIDQQMRERSGDSKQDMLNEKKALRSMLKAEPIRAAKYPSMRARWEALSPEAQGHYIAMRDKYRERSDMVEKGLIDRINATDAPDNHKRKLVNVIRQQFETQRLQGVYFPLQRFGQYFVAATKGDESTFLMYESLNKLEAGVQQLRARGWSVTAQGLKSKGKAADAPSGTFVAEVIAKLKAAHISESTQDEIYQMYLQALPELSMRKHAIHRKAIPGFDPDALRAFAFNMQHGAHQIARLNYAYKLADTLTVLRAQQDQERREDTGDTRKIAAVDALLGELELRHQWIMNPTDSKTTGLVSSFGFLYYLGLTPAAAMVNLTQTAMLTFPYLASRYGTAKAMNHLLAGMRDSIRTGGHIQKVLTNPDELRAHAELQRMGALDKSQAHNLAGIAEGGLVGHNPKWAKAMSIIGLPFHKAEVVNRESSGIAAYRLARADGKSHEEAVKDAARTITDTHFDYQNQNRARFMQNGAAKALLMFRQYSLNMTWHMGRMLWQATKNADPAVRSLARRNLAGVLGMAALFAGTLGLPLVSVTFGILNAIAATFGDDDEPWDAETEFRAFLADMFGGDLGSVIADGPINKLTGAGIASRVSLSQLWFRDADRELDGRGAYYNLLEQAAGPMGGVLKNALVGKQMIDEGHVYRGVETMLPKALKDMLKSARYATQGVNNLRGDPLVADVSLRQTLLQLSGFTPAEVAEQYEINRSLKNYEQHILDRRSYLLDAFAMALRMDDAEARQAVMRKIINFNKDNPELPITTQGIRQSMGARARYSAQAENGIVLNRKLAARLRERVGAGE